MTSAVSSDMAETLVDMSDTYLRLIHSISSKVSSQNMQNIHEFCMQTMQLLTSFCSEMYDYGPNKFNYNHAVRNFRFELIKVTFI